MDEELGEWVGIEAAARFLRTSPTQVYRYVRRGDLHARARHPRIRRDELVQLKQRRLAPRPVIAPKIQPPDDEHEWVGTQQAANLLEFSAVAVRNRAKAGRIPAVRRPYRWWFRLDHPTLFRQAQVAARSTKGAES